MRIFILILSITINASVNYGQIKPVLNAGYSGLLGYLTNHGYQFQEFQIGVGNKFNERLSVHLNYKYIWYAYYKPTAPDNERMKSNILSISTGYRFLKEQNSVSPLIMLNIGIPIHSNADSTFMHGYTIVPKYELGSWRYNRGLFFGKIKALCDVKVQAFNLQFGVSTNIMYYNRSVLEPNYTPGSESNFTIYKSSNTGLLNFGLEAGLMYTIPRKKDKKDSSSNETE